MSESTAFPCETAKVAMLWAEPALSRSWEEGREQE